VLHLLQLEKVIGKLKTAKYGSRIIELMRSHTNSETNRGKEVSYDHGAKKIKMKDKNVVCVESSEEE
jgi:ATP-dependent DNA helicase Q1